MPTPYRQLNKKDGPGIGPLLLYFLPLPLLFVAIASLLSGNIGNLIFSGLALGLTWLGAWFLRQGAKYEWIAGKRKWARATRVPWRFSAAVFIAIAAFLISNMLAGMPFIVSIITAVLGFAGVVLAYGFDPQYDTKQDVSRFGVTTEEIVEALDEAEGQLAQIEASAKQIGNSELKMRLGRIVSKTRGVLSIIEDDPKDLRRARKFLKVYLTGAKNVSAQYARTHQLQDNETLEQNFRNVLESIETVIEEQHNKLLENDALDLDVKIEVLEAQLKHEGII
ncbi:MAG: 5-bromo-4-chloroindolyl phosphate hydrolysis family protein [Acidiferrobacterales bacterium]|nr:5-bromo-4-chloroindolyl phosphate hydrolysis family protein [Acidiferrobacterales bacterium]